MRKSVEGDREQGKTMNVQLGEEGSYEIRRGKGGERMNEQSCGQDYARGGNRDPRIRAVRGVIAIEHAVGVIEEQLLPVRYGGRLRRIGRFLLRYEQKQQHFRWRWRRGPRDWQEVGVSVPREMRERVQAKAWAKIEAVEWWLEIRKAGIAALRLIEWCAKSCERWEEEVITLRWCGAEVKVTWAFPLNGGRLRKRGVVTEQGPPVQFQHEIEELMRGHKGDVGTGGPVTVEVERLVNGLAEIDQRLQILADELQRVVRVYYSPNRDTWRIRHLIGRGGEIYRDQEIPTRVRTLMTPAEETRSREVQTLLTERRRIRVALQIIATVAEVVQGSWPSGRWQIRGADGRGRVAAWVTTVSRFGILHRQYQRRQIVNGCDVGTDDRKESGNAY